VSYGNLGGPFFALRVEAEGKTIACTGDTEWTDTLIDAGKDADLFIADAYYYEKKVPLHLNLATIEEKLPLINPKRLVLTHMNDDMLNRLDDLSYECAEDVKVLEF
jgi:ribonuclease BN (tRNA processing enzyme)